MYSISLPKVGYFLVVPPEGCRGNIVDPDRAQEKSKGGKNIITSSQKRIKNRLAKKIEIKITILKK